MTQAICLYRKRAGVEGPLFIGIDTHAPLSPGLRDRLGGVRRQRRHHHDRRPGRLHAHPGDFPRDPRPQPLGRSAGSPTESSSRPSHNPPEDGGFKYNPDQRRPRRRGGDRLGSSRPANELSCDAMAGVRRMPYERGAARPACIATTISSSYVATSGTWSISIWSAHRASPSGSILWAEPASATGRDHRSLWPGGDRCRRRGRPDLRVHARRLGREDPHGLLVALRHGAADRRCAIASTWPSATTPTPTGTAW